ncbi:nucleotide exchange factor GrpE [Candidatus Saccharibacteria bacterium]|jgi:molecular chaperone GrpE|nr:nucleotide exchange factor GrpE [Candidatus Saccharibacteria bacterium]
MVKNHEDGKEKLAKKSSKKNQDKANDLEQKNGELILDLQRIRADFENYRKRTEADVQAARQSGGNVMIVKLLPIIDTLDRAISQAPDELVDNAWVKGVLGTAKKLEKLLLDLQIERIPAKIGDEFNPELHYAVQYDEESKGDRETITEELQAGYTRDGEMIRQAMVRVGRTKDKQTQ